MNESLLFPDGELNQHHFSVNEFLKVLTLMWFCLSLLSMVVNVPDHLAHHLCIQQWRR